MDDTTICKTLPPTLQQHNYRFCKVLKRDKKAFEKGWHQGYDYMDEAFVEHVEAWGGNYGVITSHGGICILDLDNQEAIEAIEPMLPRTFTVKTSKGKHYYYTTTENARKLVLKTKGIHLGELQAGKTFYVVGPNSTHPSGHRYEVCDPTPIAHVPFSKFLMMFQGLYPPKITRLPKPKMHYESDVNFSIAKIAPTNLKPRGGEFQGPHPVHGSTTGQNFSINTMKNCWCCYRCMAGGGPLKLLALMEGIIHDCTDDIGGERFLQVLDIARERRLI